MSKENQLYDLMMNRKKRDEEIEIQKEKRNNKSKSSTKFIVITSLILLVIYISIMCIIGINGINYLMEDNIFMQQSNLISNEVSKNNKKRKDDKNIERESTDNSTKSNISLYSAKELVSIDDNERRVLPSTTFLFKTKYAEDNTIKEEKKRPSSYDVNLTYEELKQRYLDWNIVYFDSDEVIFEKKLDTKSPDYYVIGEKDGYMAVFYQNPTLGLRLREITEKLLTTFPEEEKKKLEEGIVVYGEDNLIRILEDYNS